MPWLDTPHLLAALVSLVVCAAFAWFAPPLIARLPEPEPDAGPPSGPEPGAPVEPGPESDAVAPPDPGGSDRRLFERTLPARPPKELYTELAALPRLSLWLALGSAVVGAAVGLALGWTGALLYLTPLVPIGVVLMVIDWRTTLLPTRILHPTYVLLAVLIPLAALVDHDLHGLYRAGWGWLLIGGWFWVLWWLLNAWGFGDVRLARVLGPALGYLGWSQMLIGLVLIVFIGAIGGLAMAAVRRSLRERVPYGPAMLVGAWLAVLVGPWLARTLGY